MKAKILFCTGSFKTGVGGVASYAHDFVNAFLTAYQFSIVTHDNYEKTKEPYDIFHINMTDFSETNARKLLNIIQSENPNIIINSYFPLLSLVSPFIPNSIKLINVSHFVNGKLAWAAGLNASYADNIISLSTYGKTYLEKKFKISDKNKVQTIYNYMDKLQANNVSEKKQRQILSIVYPGGCSYQKSAEIVCHALKKLLKTDFQFEFYWLGLTKIPGNRWPGVRTKQIQDCLNATDPRIKQMGPVPRDMAQQIMANANIFLLPSRGEGCPITLLEAMRGGCIPIISNAKHGSLDLIENNVNGFVTRQNNATDIKNCICDILVSPQKYSYIYDNSLKKFNKELEYNIWLDKMKAMLNTPTSHQQRIAFSNTLYKKGKKRLQKLYFIDWFKDRFIHQTYHFFFFRYLRYMIKP